jgi:hypothetical protein
MSWFTRKSENKVLGCGGKGSSAVCDVLTDFTLKKITRTAIKPTTKSEVYRRVTIRVRQGFEVRFATSPSN